MKKLIYIFILAIAIIASCTKIGDSSVSSETGVDANGQGGSMAKFSISGDYLYLINETDLKIYDITNEAQPLLVNSLIVNFGIETVFTLDHYLFIGSVNGMYIYDIAVPTNIKYESFYRHITSCDPVVANDTLAFVTLNSTSSCNWQNGANRLDVIDISNKTNPFELSSINMESPQGLGIYENYIFVCDGSSGVKYYDYSDPRNLEYIGNIGGIDSYDVIIRENTLFLIGKDGLFQYDIEDINNVNLISNILFQ